MKSTRKAGPPLLTQLESQVHVWFARPEAATDPARLTCYASMLSAAEKTRHRRFHFDRDRHLFLVSHALVRRVLSSDVDVEPSRWQFSTNDLGRTGIVNQAVPRTLLYNLSQSAVLSA